MPMTSYLFASKDIAMATTSVTTTAKANARSPVENDEQRQYLMFSLDGETFAVAIGCVREIIEYPGLTSIPLAPAFIRGVINLRGAVVPVIDLSVRFGRAATNVNRRTCVIIVEVRNGDQLHLLGVVVDGVTEVRDVDASEVEKQPEFGSGLRSDFVAGMLRREQGFVVILDIATVLSGEELSALVQTGAPLAQAL
jgi:purine-binding chemotaxis protein CheW